MCKGNNTSWIGKLSVLLQLSRFICFSVFPKRIAALWIYVDDVECSRLPDTADLVVSDYEGQFDVICTKPLRGSVVKFSKDGINNDSEAAFLSFCEVQIWGKFSDRWSVSLPVSQ